MTLLWFPVGLVFPSVIGWLALQLLEGKTRVLGSAERWVLGCILGLTATMFWFFLAQSIAGVPFTLLSLVLLQAALLLPLAYFWKRQERRGKTPMFAPPPSSPLSKSMIIALCALGVWTLIKISAGTLMLIGTPAYFDDTIDNWNYRGKIFYETNALTLILPPDTAPNGVSSYPPTVPLTKTWLATLAGRWDEGLANSVHLTWFLGALLLVYFALRRRLSLPWALGGAYLLASLPLYLLQGLNAYGDVFLSVHIFAVLSLLSSALQSREEPEALAFLRLSAFALALVPFTKNEGLLLHFPVLVLLTAFTLWSLKRKKMLTRRSLLQAIAWYVGLSAIILIPWLTFKWIHHLPFGNAKGLSDFGKLKWQENVVFAITINTFFEANWLLLFPVLIGLLLARTRDAFRSPAVLYTVFVLLLYFGQLPLFLFTGLSAEALMQTGYARGLIHLMPAIVVVVTFLLQRLVSAK